MTTTTAQRVFAWFSIVVAILVLVLCVAGIAGIYTVCDLRSFPGLAKACGAYGMDEAALAACLADHNPVDRLRPLAEAGGSR